MSTQATLSKSPVMALKGGMYTLTTIQLISYDLNAFSQELDEKIKQAPNFFQFVPIIVDLQRLKMPIEALDFSLLIHSLKAKKLIPIGVRGANKSLKETAITEGLAVFPEEKVLAKKQSEDPKATPSSQETSSSQKELNSTPTRLITQPVRSGQQIYAQGGDLVILAPVSHGAELLADGHIHVYGTLRGRALAGVMGDKEAMIFCRSLEAELVSIAGQYRLSEDLKETCWKQSACIQLQEDRLIIKSV